MNRKANETRRARLWPRLAVVGAAATAIGVGGFAGVSAAHAAGAQATCSELRVTLGSYEGSDTNNLVTVTIDGAVHTFTFAENASRTYPWSPAANHSWSVSVDANRESGSSGEYWDWSDAGTTTACEQPTTVPATTTPETTTPGSTTPGSTTPETTVPATTTPDTTVPGTTPPTTECAEIQLDEICGPAVVQTRSQTAPSTSAGPTATSTVAAGAPSTTTGVDLTTASLPETGADTGLQLAIALSVLAAGTALVVVARRRRQASSDL